MKASYPNPDLPTMLPVPVGCPAYIQARKFWPSDTKYIHAVPNRVHKLVLAGRLKDTCANQHNRLEPYDHPDVFYFNVGGAIRAVYAEWPKDGHRKLNLLVDAVGELWRWQQVATIDEIYLMLITFDI